MTTTLTERLTQLDPDLLMKLASEKAGLTDYGDLTFVKSLRKLQQCFSVDSNFTAKGLNDFHNELVRLLVNRLRFEEELKQHPEILDEDVDDPIIIIGLPRSGTTKFMRMLGADERLLKTYMWQLINPSRFPDAVPGEQDPRIAAAFGSDKMGEMEDNPAIHKAQFFGAMEVHEDLYLSLMTFSDDWLMSGRQPSSGFAQWTRMRTEPSHMDNYLYIKKLFQYLQWQQGGRQGRRWLMKHTGHLPHLRELIAAYPKATLVHVHRHPAYSIGSVSNLIKNVWDLRIADASNKFSGAYNLERTKYALDSYVALREDPAVDREIVDIAYEQVRTDAMSVIRKIYGLAGIELTADAEASMRAWEENNPQGKRGKHEYDLADFELTEELIEKTCKAYIEKYVKPAHEKFAAEKAALA